MGDRLVKTVPIQDLTASIDGLDYHVPYRLHTVMDYVSQQERSVERSVRGPKR